jgi:hypothetical protein
MCGAEDRASREEKLRARKAQQAHERRAVVKGQSSRPQQLY